MTNEELVELIQSGDNVEKNMGLLYQQNKNLIYKFALPYSNITSMDDLMQESYFGLVKAVEKYNPEKGFKFITYAEWQIRGHLQRYCYNFGKNKRIPVHIIERMSKYYDVIRKYENEYGDKPSDDYIKQEMQINTKQLNSIRKTIQSCNEISFDDFIPGTDLTVEESISDDEDCEEDIVQRIAAEQVNSELWKCVDELNPKLKDVIYSRYKENMSQAEIANKYGVSGEMIRQYEHKAYRLLKEKDEVQNAAEFYGYNCAIAYHGGIKFFKKYGSGTEYLALKNIELNQKKNRIDKLLDNMIWEV